MSDVKINSVDVTELKPDAKYIIVLDDRAFTMAEAEELIVSLKLHGINNAVGLMSHGDVSNVKIIEQTEDRDKE